MSASPATNASNKQSSPGNESESSGFKSFWKSSNKAENPSNVTFVQQDPAPKRKLHEGAADIHMLTTTVQVLLAK